MWLVVHGHNVEITPELYSHVEGRVLSTLGTLGRQIGRVTVRVHAPVGTEDVMTICYILVELHPSGGLGIGDAAPNVETAAAFRMAARWHTGWNEERLRN